MSRPSSSPVNLSATEAAQFAMADAGVFDGFQPASLNGFSPRPEMSAAELGEPTEVAAPPPVLRNPFISDRLARIRDSKLTPINTNITIDHNNELKIGPPTMRRAVTPPQGKPSDDDAVSPMSQHPSVRNSCPNGSRNPYPPVSPLSPALVRAPRPASMIPVRPAALQRPYANPVNPYHKPSRTPSRSGSVKKVSEPEGSITIGYRRSTPPEPAGDSTQLEVNSSMDPQVSTPWPAGEDTTNVVVRNRPWGAAAADVAASPYPTPETQPPGGPKKAWVGLKAALRQSRAARERKQLAEDLEKQAVPEPKNPVVEMLLRRQRQQEEEREQKRNKVVVEETNGLLVVRDWEQMTAGWWRLRNAAPTPGGHRSAMWTFAQRRRSDDRIWIIMIALLAMVVFGLLIVLISTSANMSR